jgi:hypothetical protein
MGLFLLNNQLYRHFLYFSDLNYRLANDAKGKGGERQFNGLVDVYAKTLKTDGIQVNNHLILAIFSTPVLFFCSGPLIFH